MSNHPANLAEAAAGAAAKAEGCTLVIFGGSGDLTRRKLLPAIYNMAEGGYLPDAFSILAVARPPMDDAAYRAQMRESTAAHEGEALDAAT